MWNRALIEGLEQGRRVGLLVPLYVCGLLLGIVQSWPLGLAAFNGGLRTTFLDALVAGGVDALADLFIANPAAGQSAGVWALLTLPLLMLFSLAYTFFSGGMLSVVAGTRPFWAGCRHTFWSFSGLGLILVLAAIIISIGVGIIGAFAGLGTILTTGITFVLLQLVNLIGEYARAVAVARGRLNPFVLFGAAVAFCVRRAVGVLAMGVLGLLLNVVIVAVYLQASSVISNALLVIVLQQICVIAWLWVKFVRLGWALFYVRAVDQRMRPTSETPYTPLDNVQVIS